MKRNGTGMFAADSDNDTEWMDYIYDVVKVKICTNKLGTLVQAYEIMRKLAEEKGASPGIELLHIRKSENVIMLGKMGMKEKIESGVYPPEKVVWVKRDRSEFKEPLQ